MQKIKLLRAGALVAALGMTLALTPLAAMADDAAVLPGPIGPVVSAPDNDISCGLDPTSPGIDQCAPAADPAPETLGTISGRPIVGPYSACPEEDTYYYSSIHGSAIAAPGQTVYGDAGTTLTISETRGTTTTGTVGGSGTFDVSMIVASAQVQVNGSIALAKTSTLTRGAAWTVPKNYTKLGTLSDGAYSQHMNWSNHRLMPTCQVQVVASGTTNLPELAPYFFHN